MAKRIFISHANSDEDGNHLLPILCRALEAKGLEVLVDRERLRPGAAWRTEIYTWLSICHGAVILLSDRALAPESIWVPRETSLLMWRKALDPKLAIIPVLGQNVDLSAVEGSSKFSDLQLRELQTVGHADPDRVVEDILNGLSHGQLVDSTPFDELAEVVAAAFRALPADLLEECCDVLLAHVSVPDTFSLRHRLAMKVLSVPLESLQPVFDRIMTRCPASAREDIVDVLGILGANWVNPEAAQWIARETVRTQAQGGPRPIIINARTRFAIEMYLQRASLRPPRMRWPMVPVTGVTGGTDASEIIDEIDAALQARLPLPVDPFDPDRIGRRRRQLNKLRASGIPVFVAMKLPVEADEIRRAVAANYAMLNLIFLSGSVPASEEIYPASAYLHLAPPLGEGHEDDAQAMVDMLNAAYSLEAG